MQVVFTGCLMVLQFYLAAPNCFKSVFHCACNIRVISETECFEISLGDLLVITEFVIGPAQVSPRHYISGVKVDGLLIEFHLDGCLSHLQPRTQSGYVPECFRITCSIYFLSVLIDVEHDRPTNWRSSYSQFVSTPRKLFLYTVIHIIADGQ